MNTQPEAANPNDYMPAPPEFYWSLAKKAMQRVMDAADEALAEMDSEHYEEADRTALSNALELLRTMGPGGWLDVAKDHPDYVWGTVFVREDIVQAQYDPDYERDTSPMFTQAEYDSITAEQIGHAASTLENWCFRDYSWMEALQDADVVPTKDYS